MCTRPRRRVGFAPRRCSEIRAGAGEWLAGWPPAAHRWQPLVRTTRRGKALREARGGVGATAYPKAPAERGVSSPADERGARDNRKRGERPRALRRAERARGQPRRTPEPSAGSRSGGRPRRSARRSEGSIARHFHRSRPRRSTRSSRRRKPAPGPRPRPRASQTRAPRGRAAEPRKGEPNRLEGACFAAMGSRGPQFCSQPSPTSTFERLSGLSCYPFSKHPTASSPTFARRLLDVCPRAGHGRTPAPQLIDAYHDR